MDILKSLGHPEEILNLFKFKMGGCTAVMPKLDYVSKSTVYSSFNPEIANITTSAPPLPTSFSCLTAEMRLSSLTRASRAVILRLTTQWRCDTRSVLSHLLDWFPLSEANEGEDR